MFDGQSLDWPLTEGVAFLHHQATGRQVWLRAQEAINSDGHSAVLKGIGQVDGATLTFTLQITLRDDMPAACLTLDWSLDKSLPGWEIGFACHGTGGFDWRIQSYPWAGNSEEVSIAPMRYCGVPAALVYRPDLSRVVLFAIDSRFDYLNPTTWTGTTGFHFTNRKLAPQFRVGGAGLEAATNRQMHLQLLVSGAGDSTQAITQLVGDWIRLNDYRVDTSLQVRTPQEAFQIAVEGRRGMEAFKPGVGYEHHKNTPFVYVGNNPYIAYYEYRLYELTGDRLWRDRAFEQMDFVLGAQQSDPAKPNHGVMHTSWYFKPQQRPGGEVAEGFCSWDWMHNGYKVDLNVWMARYMLQTWQRVRQREGTDRQDWFQAAVAAADWAITQQNEDGGLPQVVDTKTGQKSNSVVSGRALVGLPIIAKITLNDRYLEVSRDMEQFVQRHVESRFWYTGMHPDLPPNDFEQDSLWAVVEYYLDRHDKSDLKEHLDRAVANALLGLLYWCPKQLSWVKAPTQCAHSEQQHFNQYSVYSYGNRKIECLNRLAAKTGNPLFASLRDRVMQLNFFTQVTEGPYRGAMTEAIADPWLERNGGFEWRGTFYTSELVTDLMLQLIEMGLVSAPLPTS